MNHLDVRIEVKGHGIAFSATEASYVRAQLARALGQFRSHIRNVTVRLTDLNGPRGGDSDIECRVGVDGGFPTVVVSERSSRVAAAIDLASDRVSRAVGRAIGRTRSQSQRIR